MAVHYLEIVSNDADTLTGLYQRMHGLSFSPPDPDLGQACVATRADGTLVGLDGIHLGMQYNGGVAP